MKILKLTGRVLLLWLGVWCVAGSVDDRREKLKIAKVTIGAVALAAFVGLGEVRPLEETASVRRLRTPGK